ncbi:unnamed protein product [Adineta steineri]|uniref:Ubiquitin thioesterase OTU n=1 Tax=Adineta steineri TaxID=433720 RepID=A0A814YHT7_9BILA|nr:unnamed protein product [Adineta steineri]CAF1247778.1 unnamed protein product [Adineta steineri]
MASNITAETREFRLSDGSNFYNCIVVGTKANINPDRAYALVQERLYCRTNQTVNALPKNINVKSTNIARKPRLVKTNNATVNENEIEALGLLTKTRLCIIYVTKYNQTISSIRVKYYGNDYKESVYMVYDETQQQYCSLYLYNTIDLSGEQITILPSYNETINILLRKFFMSNFNCHVDVQLDDELQTTANDVLHQGQPECDNIPHIIDMETEVNTSTEQGITDNDGYPTMSVTPKTTDNQISLNVANNISKTTHALFRKTIPGDGSCLYWSFINAMSLKSTMKNLRNLVADYILQMDIDDSKLQFGADCQNRQQYCDGIRNGAWAGEPELVALSQMYEIMIKVINWRRDQQQNVPIKPIPYGENNKLCTKCIYIIFDEASLHYEPLYLCDIENLQSGITIFNRDDTFVDDLLPDFIKSQIGSNDPSKVMTSTEHWLDECFHMLDSTVSKTNLFNANEQYISANNIIPTTQNAISYKTHEFRRGELPGNGQSLYDATTFLSDRSKMINIKCLRENVANVIRSHTDNDVIRSHTDNDGIHVPPSLDYDDRKDYCRKVEEGIISGSEPECYGLSYLYPDTLFCIISKPIMNNNAPCIDIYVKDISSYKKCIILLYNETSDIYMPLYLHNKINDEEEKTNFKYDDKVKDLLREFIQNKLNYCGYVSFDSEKDSHAVDSSSHVEHESIDLAERITENPGKNKSKKQNMMKRNAPEKTQSLTSSHPLPPNDQISRFHKRNDISENIDTSLQTATITNKTEEEQQRKEDLSPTLSTNTTVAACREQMRLESEPAERFHGRAKSDYMPKSNTKRDGTQAKPRKPCYFADRINQHFLNLLIPIMYLFADPSRVWVEIALVTRIIKGCIYFNSLFDFFPYKKNGSYGNSCNPIYVNLGNYKMYPLTKYTENMQQLMLKLVVIMLTNDELVKKQPLKVFKLVSSNGQRQDTKHRTHDELKKDYYLNELRFAITLWIKGPNDKEYQRRPDIQYISPISIQDKEVKLYE